MGKTVDQCAHEHECRKTGTHTHRAPKWTRRPRILNSSKSAIWTTKKEVDLALGVYSAESTCERGGRRMGLGVCRWGSQLTELARSIHPPLLERERSSDILCDTRTHGQGRGKFRPIACFSVRRLFYLPPRTRCVLCEYDNTTGVALVV
jgi:hypothetical protein